MKESFRLVDPCEVWSVINVISHLSCFDLPSLVIFKVKHVKENPADKPIANAILLLLETGARPSLVTELLSEHYQPNTFTEEAKMLGNKGTDGLLITGGTKGLKRTGEEEEVKTKPYNSPLSNRGITILQDQS